MPVPTVNAPPTVAESTTAPRSGHSSSSSPQAGMAGAIMLVLCGAVLFLFANFDPIVVSSRHGGGGAAANRLAAAAAGGGADDSIVVGKGDSEAIRSGGVQFGGGGAATIGDGAAEASTSTSALFSLDGTRSPPPATIGAMPPAAAAHTPSPTSNPPPAATTTTTAIATTTTTPYEVPHATVIDMHAPMDYAWWVDLKENSWGAPRLYDAFLFYNEIELLEVRIAELYDVVEKFVVVETLTTFGEGRSANCYFDVLKLQLPVHFLQKVAHFKCKLVADGGAWDREANARLCQKRAAMAAGLRTYDLLHFSDADEIARSLSFSYALNFTREVMRSAPHYSMRALRELKEFFPVGVRMQYYAYNLKTITLPDDPKWATDLFFIFDLHTLTELRRGGDRQSHTREAGWHCSWCFPRVSHFKEKFLAYSHTETVDERNYSPENVWNATCNGDNIFKYAGPKEGRATQFIEELGGYLTPPQYVLDRAHDSRFQFLVPDKTTCKIPL